MIQKTINYFHRKSVIQELLRIYRTKYTEAYAAEDMPSLLGWLNERSDKSLEEMLSRHKGTTGKAIVVYGGSARAKCPVARPNSALI
jgi:hypothetical protein